MRMRMMDRVSIERTSKLKAFVFLRIFGFLGSLLSFVKMLDVLRMDFFFGWSVPYHHRLGPPAPPPPPPFPVA